jgi:hypothetical protein
VGTKTTKEAKRAYRGSQGTVHQTRRHHLTMQSKSLDDDYFIKNAILCFLHYYPNHKWTAIYEELAKRDTFIKDAVPTKPRTRTRKSNAKKTDD